MLCREVNHGGLAQLYEILLESATAQIVAALRLVLNAAEAGRNALLFCKVSAVDAMRPGHKWKSLPSTTRRVRMHRNGASLTRCISCLHKHHTP